MGPQLSIWIQLLLTLFMVSAVSWCSSALDAARLFDERVRVEAQHHAAIDEAARFAPTFRIAMLLVWAFIGSDGAGHLNRGQIVHNALAGVGTGLPILIFVLLVGNWVHVLIIYRDRIMRMRRGEYFFERNVYREELASLYIGYQVAGMTLSGFFFMASGLALVVVSPLGLEPSALPVRC
jgi:hypothetical protein